MLELLKLKASHGWSNNSFSKLLSLLAKLLPKSNTLPTSTYKAKKLICLLFLSVDKIHACHNHYILYRKEHEFKTKCPVCGVSQYKRSYNHVYADTMKKKNKKKTAIGPESDNNENDFDKEDKKKRKISALVMWYLPVINHLKRVFSNPRDVELICWHSEKRRKMMRRFDTLRMELSGIFLSSI
jgi:predicted  nucleic acid-binding Zn-ribbon protein